MFLLRLLSFLVLATFSFAPKLHAQEENLGRIADSIEYEGKQLYRSERASWLGTDIFLDKYPDKKEQIGGYVSYSTSPSETRCVFYTKGDQPVVMATILFDTTYAPRNTNVDDTQRPLSAEEQELCAMRKEAKKLIKEEDRFFKHYSNTNYNLIPIKIFGQKRLYILTGPEKEGIILFGNDYLITYNEDNSIRDHIKLHASLIEMPIQKGILGDTSITSGYHTHIVTPFMTPTDICTLMLYGRFTNMKSYMVMSKKYYSQWSLENNNLLIMTTKAIMRIDKDQKKRHRGE